MYIYYDASYSDIYINGQYLVKVIQNITNHFQRITQMTEQVAQQVAQPPPRRTNQSLRQSTREYNYRHFPTSDIPLLRQSYRNSYEKIGLYHYEA